MRDSHNEGLCIFGSEDRHYDEGRLDELKRNPRLQLHVMEGTNHSLEHDFNVIDSISTHREIMKIIEDFKERRSALFSFIPFFFEVSFLALFL